MRLNTIQPTRGARKAKKRVGRGIGCGQGKTCGHGHKGQLSRRGAGTIIGFEGGQMPIQRRLPKVGFKSRRGRYVAEVRLHELANIDVESITLDALKKANVVDQQILHAKVILSGKIEKPVVIKGLGVTKGARQAIEAQGGKIEE